MHNLEDGDHPREHTQMCLLIRFSRNLYFLSSLAATIAVVAGVFVFSCEAVSAEQPDSERRRIREDVQGSADVSRRDHGFPGNDSRPLPDALASGNPTECQVNLKDWKPALSIKLRNRRFEELTPCGSRLGGTAPRPLSDRSLRILYCTWLI